MVWNSLWPDGTTSVKQNSSTGQQNTSYIETSMNQDHFWNRGTDEDGHHKAINMKNYADTSTGAPSDAPIATGFDGVFYVKQVNGRNAGFYRNSNGVFQCVPGFISGSANINSGYQNIVTVPDGCYGNIWLFRNDNSSAFGFGSFKATGGICQAFCVQVLPGNTTTPQLPFRFGSGDQVSGLNLRIRTSDAPSGVYEYRIQFWGF